MIPQPNPRQIVDMQIPLTWLLSAGAAMLMFMASMVWSVAGQSNDLRILVVASAKMEKRMDDGAAKADTRSDEVRDRFSSVDRTTDNLKLRVEAVERAVRK